MASQETLEVQVRAETGKSAARKLRARGLAPGIVYGHGQQPVPVAFDARQFMLRFLRKGGGTTLLQLIYPEGQQGPLTMVNAVQRDPISGSLLNVDFQAVSLTEKVHTTVPVVLVGEPAGHRQGGILEHLVHEVQVECLASDIPAAIRVDVSPLLLGSIVHVKDLPLPQGVHVLNPADEVVALVAAPAKPQVEEAAREAAPEPEEVAAETEETA